MQLRTITTLAATGILMALVAGQVQSPQTAPAQPQKKMDGKPLQVIDGRLVGFDMPADWKIAERAKNLTYTNRPGRTLQPAG